MNADFLSAPESVYKRGVVESSKTELLRALGKLIRGLSALFWGLPLMLVVYVQTARTDWLDILGWFAMAPSLIVTALVFYGLNQMHSFQAQERIWIRALDRAQILVFVNFGLCPFLFWWHRMPTVKFFAIAVGVLAFSSLLFLFNLNYVLERLTAMLPDETLRTETRVFTSLNRTLICAVPVLVGIDFILNRLSTLPSTLIILLDAFGPFKLWLLLFLILMPLAMTMALIWKVKEVIFTSVFQSE